MYICGQKKLLDNISSLIDQNKFPNFSIICGLSGGGKRLIADHIAHSVKAILVPCELSVDSVRSVILSANSTSEKLVFMFADAHKMSQSAMNSLLKVSEECPERVYIILTTVDKTMLLPTIVNRAHVFNIDQYTKSDLNEFVKHRNMELSSAKKSVLLSVCSTPGELLENKDVDIEYVYGLCDKFVEFIGDANLSNSLKISTYLKLKKDDKDGIDVVLFMNTVMLVAHDLMKQFDNTSKYLKIIKFTNSYKSDMNIGSINKSLLVDNWILSLYCQLNEVMI